MLMACTSEAKHVLAMLDLFFVLLLQQLQCSPVHTVGVLCSTEQ
jgi:hypothetical protein